MTPIWIASAVTVPLPISEPVGQRRTLPWKRSIRAALHDGNSRPFVPAWSGKKITACRIVNGSAPGVSVEKRASTWNLAGVTAPPRCCVSTALPLSFTTGEAALAPPDRPAKPVATIATTTSACVDRFMALLSCGRSLDSAGAGRNRARTLRSTPKSHERTA